MVKTNQFSSILIYLFFIALLSIGLFVESKFAYMKYIHGAILLFLVTLTFNQLRVWHVKREGDFIVFSSFFGIIKKRLTEDEDYLSVDGYLNYRNLPDVEQGSYLILKTKKWKFKFYSGDYKNFNVLLNELFQRRMDLKIEFTRLLSQERRNHIDYSWFIYLLIMIVFILYK